MKKEQIIHTVKTGVGFVVSVGVGAIVGNLVKSTTPADTSKIIKACIKVGGFVLSSACGEIASNYTDDQIDEAVIFAEGFIKPEESEESTDVEETKDGEK